MVGPDSKIVTEESNSDSSKILMRAKHIDHNNKLQINNKSPDPSMLHEVQSNNEGMTLTNDIDDKAF